MHFLGCLFALALGIIFIGATFIGSIINFILSLFGIGKRVNDNAFGGYRSNGQSSANYGQTQNQQQEEQRQQSQRSQQTAGQQRGKIFEKNDSEYVDFEEV